MEPVVSSRFVPDQDGAAFPSAHVLRPCPAGNSSPFTSLWGKPHRPDRVTPSQGFGSKAKAYPAKDDGYPIPVSKGGGAGAARDGGHGRNRIPVVLGARLPLVPEAFGQSQMNAAIWNN